MADTWEEQGSMQTYSATKACLISSAAGADLSPLIAALERHSFAVVVPTQLGAGQRWLDLLTCGYWDFGGLLSSTASLSVWSPGLVPAGHFADACTERSWAPPPAQPIRALLREGEFTMARDPVCGMHVEEQRAAGTSEYQGETCYFCSAS